MQLGVLLAHLGPSANDDSIRAAAQAAEVLGYHSLWAVDPDVAPVAPGITRPTPANRFDGVDAVPALVVAAEATERVLLGLHLPVRVASRVRDSHRLLDAASERLVVAVDVRGHDDRQGTAEGWLKDAVARIATSLPRPPARLLVASAAGGPGETIAAAVDGWFATRSALDEIARAWSRIGECAAQSGRETQELAMFIRADVALTVRPLSRHRSTFCGSIDQVVDDLVAVADLGADVAVLAFAPGLQLDALLGGYAAIAEGLELRAPT